MSDNTDPKIVNRLKDQPPYKDETPEETPIEETKETPVEEPKEEVKEEPKETKEEETKKRTTEQFDKLKDHNNKLKEELETEKKKNILDSLIPEPVVQPPQVPHYPQPPITNVVPTPQQFPGLSKKDIKEAFQGLVDENGYVDTGLLIGTLNELKEKNRLAEERAVLAEQKATATGRKFDEFERNETMRKVHEKFPTLNPESENFDEKLWKYVRNEVVDQWMNGKQTDVMAAAQEGMDTLHPVDMKKADKVKIEQAETAKKNINALGASRSSQRDNYSDHETLVKATQQGKKGALAERLRKAGM